MSEEKVEIESSHEVDPSHEIIEYSLSIVPVVGQFFNLAFFESIKVPELFAVWQKCKMDLLAFVNTLNPNQKTALENGIPRLFNDRGRLKIRTNVLGDLATAGGIINFLNSRFSTETVPLSEHEKKIYIEFKSFFRFYSCIIDSTRARIIVWVKTLINKDNIGGISQTSFSESNKVGGILALKSGERRLLKMSELENMMKGQPVPDLFIKPENHMSPASSGGGLAITKKK